MSSFTTQNQGDLMRGDIFLAGLYMKSLFVRQAVVILWVDSRGQGVLCLFDGGAFYEYILLKITF